MQTQMLLKPALLGNMGAFELVVILVIAVLVFGKDLPQAATKAYLQIRKLRGAVDELRRDSGIDRELRNIERTVREAEWEARKSEIKPSPTAASSERTSVPRSALPAGDGDASAAAVPEAPGAESPSGAEPAKGAGPAKGTELPEETDESTSS